MKIKDNLLLLMIKHSENGQKYFHGITTIKKKRAARLSHKTVR